MGPGLYQPEWINQRNMGPGLIAYSMFSCVTIVKFVLSAKELHNSKSKGIGYQIVHKK